MLTSSLSENSVNSTMSDEKPHFLNPFEKTKVIRQNEQDIVFGYLRICQYLLPMNQPYFQIVDIIQIIILLFYANLRIVETNEFLCANGELMRISDTSGNHRQIITLNNDDLRKRSIELITMHNNEFIKFLKKVLKSTLAEKIWCKCDPNNTEKIGTEKFVYFWTLPVTLFKVALYQRKHGNKEKPKLNHNELKKDFIHLATWVIRKYGEKQTDGTAIFVLKRDNYTKKIVEYVKNYVDHKGELYEDHSYAYIYAQTISDVKKNTK
eukprot:511502_1